MITVKKPFNTRVTRFNVGDRIRQDADLAPHDLDGLKKGGFIEMPEPPSAKPKDSRKG